jgi:imidazoleglycerol-phosphate dehydratase
MKKKIRQAELRRKTKESEVRVKLVLDGTGQSKLRIPVNFMSHLLASFARHSLINLELSARGDIEIDEHHTIEDIGLALGETLDKALGDKKGINRFGFAIAPMDEALAAVAIDISGRPFLVYRVEIPKQKQWEFNVNLVEDFFRAFVNKAGITLHIRLEYGSDYHHSLEAVFKALGLAFRKATALNPRIRSIPSTKGML